MSWGSGLKMAKEKGHPSFSLLLQLIYIVRTLKRTGTSIIFAISKRKGTSIKRKGTSIILATSAAHLHCPYPEKNGDIHHFRYFCHPIYTKERQRTGTSIILAISASPSTLF